MITILKTIGLNLIGKWRIYSIIVAIFSGIFLTMMGKIAVADMQTAKAKKALVKIEVDMIRIRQYNDQLISANYDNQKNIELCRIVNKELAEQNTFNAENQEAAINELNYYTKLQDEKIIKLQSKLSQETCSNMYLNDNNVKLLQEANGQD